MADVSAMGLTVTVVTFVLVVIAAKGCAPMPRVSVADPVPILGFSRINGKLCMLGVNFTIWIFVGSKSNFSFTNVTAFSLGIRNMSMLKS